MRHQRTNLTTRQSAYLHKVYSQNNEQQIIDEYFNKAGIIGNVLDIGANDGITFSNSYHLIKNKGWYATLVEPSPRAFAKLHDLHLGAPGVQLIKAAAGAANETAMLKESGSLVGPDDVALVSSFLPAEQQRWASLNMPFEDVQVQVMDVVTLLKTCDYDQYHFVSIDIEGYEPFVVPKFNFNKLGALVVCIEWNGNNKDLFDAHMTGHQGFRLIHTNAENLIYAK